MADSEYFYPGGAKSMEPNSNLPFTTFASLGTSMDARTADQVKEASKHLNTGLKVFEVAAHQAEVFDSMPDSQLDELRRMNKLVGAEATVHAPMIDPGGFVQDRWDKFSQENAERQLWNAVERSHRINPTGNILVNFHASTTGLPAHELATKENEKAEPVVQSFLFIGPEGRVQQLKPEPRYFPNEDGKAPQGFDPKAELERTNKKQWLSNLESLSINSHKGTNFVEQVFDAVEKDYPSKSLNPVDLKKDWAKIEGEHPELVERTPAPKQIERDLLHGSVLLEDSWRNMKNFFDVAYASAKKSGDEESMKKMDAYFKKVGPQVKDFEHIKENPNEMKNFAEKIEEGLRTLSELETPKLMVPLKDFAVEKSAETISNIAKRSYEKFKDTSPIIAVENHPAYQSILTTGEDLAAVITAARDKFVKDMKDKIGKSEAEEQAKKLIGATWDVGHINMLRKYGYGEKDIIEQTKKVAPFVKHVHLSDNFGFEHTELPMGMGNVPIKEIMDKLGKEGFKGKKIVEALSWWQHFSEQGRVSAIVPTLQGFNSPIYGMQNSPYWSQATATDLIGGYSSFPLAHLPEKHFSMYGTGFSSLPQELGGSMPGTNSRFAGTPNA